MFTKIIAPVSSEEVHCPQSAFFFSFAYHLKSLYFSILPNLCNNQMCQTILIDIFIVNAHGNEWTKMVEYVLDGVILIYVWEKVVHCSFMSWKTLISVFTLPLLCYIYILLVPSLRDDDVKREMQFKCYWCWNIVIEEDVFCGFINNRQDGYELITSQVNKTKEVITLFDCIENKMQNNNFFCKIWHHQGLFQAWIWGIDPNKILMRSELYLHIYRMFLCMNYHRHILWISINVI